MRNHNARRFNSKYLSFMFFGLLEDRVHSLSQVDQYLSSTNVQEDNMHFRKSVFAVLTISLMGLAIGLTGQGMVDGIKVTLPYPVTIDEMVLEPGEYEIRRASQVQDQILRIYSNDKMRYETHVITVPTIDKDTPEDSKVVLHHIGDAYYFDKIWIAGKDYGYEFVLPERAKALKRELAESVPATYVPQAAATPSTPSTPAAVPTPGAPSPADPSQADAQVERDRQAELAAQAAQAERDRQAQAERNRQAELTVQAERDRQAQVQRDSDAFARAQAESQRQAQAEVTREGVSVAQAQSRAGQRDAAADNTPNDGRLPETAANWLGYLLGGVGLITLSAFIRSRIPE